MKILVIEDEHRIAAAIKKGLEQERQTVDLAYDGVEGFDLATSDIYDLIILDLMLPLKDGMSVCVDLRKNNIQTPILMLTAKGQVEDKVKGLNSGADDYLVKPFAFEELLARIRALTRRPKKIDGEILKYENLSLDPKSFEVKRNNKKINLSGKEFSILEMLLRHSEKILTKEQIMNHVWDYEADVLPNTVEVYIKKLREKVGKDIIQTVRGFGYKLEKNV
jgi:two-component system copper resistance phosphate regulon response regulator CusR